MRNVGVELASNDPEDIGWKIVRLAELGFPSGLAERASAKQLGSDTSIEGVTLSHDSVNTARGPGLPCPRNVPGGFLNRYEGTRPLRGVIRPGLLEEDGGGRDVTIARRSRG